MSVTDPLGDMLTRIRNGQKAGLSKVSAPKSKLQENVLAVLKKEGYIRDYQAIDGDSGKNSLNIELKYFEGQPVIREITRVSKPGRRIYVGVVSIPRVYNGFGVAILSTPQGVMTDSEARAAHTGGELLCRVF